MENIGTCHPKLKRGKVWCYTCGATIDINSGHALRCGWPKCCGHTMSLYSPEERGVLTGLAKKAGVEKE